MDAVESVLAALIEIHGARAQRVVGATRHAVGELSCQRIALNHFLRRMPVGPFGLPADLGDAAPGKAKPTDTDAIGDGGSVGQNVVELALAGADDDGAGLFGGP